MALVLCQNLGLGLLSALLVAERGVDDNLLVDGAVLELHGQRVGDGAEVLVVVVLGELWVLNALDLLAEALDEWGGGGFASIGVVGGFKTAVDEHDRGHVLDAVVAVGKVVHGLELFVDDADAGLVRAAGHSLDVGSGLALGLETGVDVLCGFNGGLGVELGCGIVSRIEIVGLKINLPGYETLKRTFSIT